MGKIQKLILLLSAVGLSGCVSVRSVPTDTKSFDAFQGMPLTIVTYKKPDFAASTYGAVTFGIIGALSMIDTGNQVIAKNDVPDPATRIAAKLSADISPAFKTSSLNVVPDIGAQSDDEDTLTAIAAKKGLILDVETISWSFSYFPLDWTHYKVIYVARARLIDANTGKRIAQAPCRYQSEDQQPPDYDTMLANRAEVLKSMLSAASDKCTGMMKQLLLGT